MSRITFAQLQKRTKHELLSDEEACCNDRVLGPTTVRRAERTREKHYPLHRRLRLAAIRYFLDEGWDVVPHGVGVWGANGALADLAIAKGRRIVLVECLTPSWVTYQNAARKRRLEQFFPLWFFIEHPVVSCDVHYKQRVERMASRSRVFSWRQQSSLTRSWCGPAASVVPYQPSVPAGRTARR